MEERKSGWERELERIFFDAIRDPPEASSQAIPNQGCRPLFAEWSEARANLVRACFVGRETGLPAWPIAAAYPTSRLHCAVLRLFRMSFNSGSSQPKQVSRSARRWNAFVHAGSSFAYCSSACTVSSIKPPTVPSESSTPPRDNLSSSRKRSLMSSSVVCSLTGSSEIITDSRLHPCLSEP
jgi:hypothetical protein